MGVDLLDDEQRRAQVSGQAAAGTPKERQDTQNYFYQHVAKTPYLTDKVKPEDYTTALSTYDTNRSQGQGWADASNHAISAMKWDNPSAWQTSATATDPNAGQTTPPKGTRGSDQGSIIQSFFGELAPTSQSLDPILAYLNGNGFSAQRATRAGNLPSDDKIIVNGQMYDLIRDVGGPGAAWMFSASGTGIGGVQDTGYSSQFGDPSTNQFEQLLQARMRELSQGVNDPSRQLLEQLLGQQTQMYQQQQAEQQRQNAILRQRQEQARQQTDKFVSYANERATKLQGPAYTGSEENILRTQALDPIENDRQAALKRALDNIGSRGFDPSSGIAQDLMRQVNSSSDRERSSAQNNIAVRQVEEQRSREQEAQQLLAYIPQAQMAAASGDLAFLQQLDQAVSALGARAGQSATQSVALGQSVRDEEARRRDELLARSGQLYELPMNAAQGAMAALGQAPNPANMTAQTIQLAQLAQQQQNQQASFWLNLGSSFAPFFK